MHDHTVDKFVKFAEFWQFGFTAAPVQHCRDIHICIPVLWFCSGELPAWNASSHILTTLLVVDFSNNQLTGSVPASKLGPGDWEGFALVWS